MTDFSLVRPKGWQVATIGSRNKHARRAGKLLTSLPGGSGSLLGAPVDVPCCKAGNGLPVLVALVERGPALPSTKSLNPAPVIAAGSHPLADFFLLFAM